MYLFALPEKQYIVLYDVFYPLNWIDRLPCLPYLSLWS